MDKDYCFKKYYDCDERDTTTCQAPIYTIKVACEFGSSEWKLMMKEIARNQLMPPVELLVDLDSLTEGFCNFASNGYSSEDDGDSVVNGSSTASEINTSSDEEL